MYWGSAITHPGQEITDNLPFDKNTIHWNSMKQPSHFHTLAKPTQKQNKFTTYGIGTKINE